MALGIIGAMPSPYALKYLLTGLDAAPDVQRALCSRVQFWDVRPGPERFSVREALAHLADWEPIWLERVTRTVLEDVPRLPDKDEGQIAIDHDYGSSDPAESLDMYRARRDDLINFLRARSDHDWARKCFREGQGEMTLFELGTIILGHDAYHFRHTVDSLKA